MEGLAATPAFDSEPLDGRVVDCLRVACVCFGVEKVVHVFGKDGGNSVHSLVPAQAFRPETCHCANDGLEVCGKLVLNDGVKDGVRPQIWQFGPRHAMVVFGEFDSYLLVKREPLGGFGRVLGIVAIHNAGLLVANVRHERRAKGREAAFGTSARWRG